MSTAGPANRPTEPEALVLEAWGQGMMVGALVVMAALTIAQHAKGRVIAQVDSGGGSLTQVYIENLLTG